MLAQATFPDKPMGQLVLTCLAAFLLGIRDPEHLSIHSARGALFENFVISRFLKDWEEAGKEDPAKLGV